MILGLAGEKIILGSAIAVGTAVSGLGTYHFLSKPTTIGESLQKEGLLLLDTKETDKWEILVKKYKGEITTENTTPKIKSSGEEDVNIQNKEELQNECKKLWDTKLSEAEERDISRKKQEIKTWCINDPETLKSN